MQLHPYTCKRRPFCGPLGLELFKFNFIQVELISYVSKHFGVLCKVNI